MSNALFKKLQENRREAADILERPSLKGVKYSVVEKYSEQAHFIYELLQNADDVKAKNVKFILDKEGLIFIHDGEIKFNVTNPDEEIDESKPLGHINAITSIGNSSKTDLQIGKFGVGFKSVFQYTNNPEIYEDEFKFYIDRFIVPILKNDDHPLRKDKETLFYFPFNSDSMPFERAYKDISQKFEGLENPLMFIKSLISINWKTVDDEGKYSKIIHKKKYWNALKIEEVQTLEQKGLLENNNYYLTFTEETVHHRKFKNIIAFELDTEKNVIVNHRFPTYCFFPTKESSNLKFIIQAPFLLIDNRQGIKKGNDWNELLINQLSDLLIKSIRYFKENEELSERFFNVLPIEKELFEEGSFYFPFYEKVRNIINQEAILPTKEGNLTTKENTFIAENESLLALLSSNQLTLLLKNATNWVFPSLAGFRRKRDTLGDYLFEEIGIKQLTPSIFTRNLTTEFLKVQSDEWLANFYQYVGTVPSLWEDLKQKPIIRTINNEQVNPYNTSRELAVFLPSNTLTTFPTVKSVFTENKAILSFFERLGIKESDLKAEIELKIIPLYQKGEVSKEQNFDFFKLFFTHFGFLSNYEQLGFIAKIKDLSIVEGINLEDDVRLIKPNLAYKKTNELELFFENYRDTVYWLSPTFVQKLTANYDENDIEIFLIKLGVAILPRQVIKQYSPTYANKKRLGVPNVYPASREYNIYDYAVEGLENAISQITFPKSKIIWNFLKNVLSSQVLKSHGEFNYFYFTERKAYFETSYIKFLKRRIWLYVSNKNNVRPRNITKDQLENSGYDVESSGAKRLLELLSIANDENSLNNIEWTEEEKFEILDKARKYEEYEKFIQLIPKEKLEQLYKEQEILNTRPKNTPTSKPQKGILVDDKILSKEDLVARIKDIQTKSKVIDNLSLESVLAQQEEELIKLQEKITNTTIVESEEKKVLYVNLMSLRDFAIELSHVIKTALSKVLNQALFFKEEYPNKYFEDDFKIYAQEMHYDLDKLKRVVNFMLDYTEVEKYYETFDIVPLIQFLFQLLYKKDIERENIIIELDLKHSLSISYNKKSFEDIIGNLITNSIKALKGNEIGDKIIKCTTSMNEETNEFIILFSDNGHGVAEDIKDNIFEAYTSTTQKYGGAGVGLYIVKMRLKALRGQIELVENNEIGATFKIILPLK
jgi:signal transduction histidine kinase